MGRGRVLAEQRMSGCLLTNGALPLTWAECVAVPGWVDAASCDDFEQSGEGCCSRRRAHLHHGQAKVHSWVRNENAIELMMMSGARPH